MLRSLLKQVLWLHLLLVIAVAGDLRVNITNGSLKQSGRADHVSIKDLAAGMVELGSAVNVIGSTTFSNVNSGAQNQYLIQATLNGVTYSATFIPSPTVTAWETSITVFESQAIVRDVNASVPFFVIYGFKDKLYIQKRLILENVSNPPISFMAAPGLINVHIPENVTEIEYLTYKNGSMPISTSPIKTQTGQVLPNPIKPGITEIDIAYYLPYDDEKATVSELVGYDIDHFHVYTMPLDLKISLPGLSREGTDNENGLAIYAMEKVKAGQLLEFQVSGQGMSENDPDQHANHEQSTGKIVVETRLDTSTELLISAVLIMAILMALFISISQQNEDMKQGSIQMLKDQKIVLLKEYSSFKDSAAANPERDKVLYHLVSVYKTLDRIK